MRKSALALLLLLPSFCWAVPDRNMEITPIAVSGETISASDENSRNNEVSTKFNAHDHAAISSSTVNTFTIGDNAVGNKTYAVDTDQSSNPGFRYNTSIDLWTLSNDGSTYLAAAHADTNDGFVSGAILYGGSTSGAILSAGTAANGQILIGRTNGAPLLATLTAGDGASVSNGPASITVAGSFAAPSLTLSTTNSAGTAATIIRSDATVAAFDATVPAALGTAATGSAGTAARRDHVHPGQNFERGIVDETADATAGSVMNGSDISVTLDVASHVTVILLGRITVVATGNAEYAIHRDGVQQVVEPNYTDARTVGEVVNLAWSEALNAGTYAYDARTNANDSSGTTTLDYQLIVIATPQT